jgi:osmotically-inducible protein OsmY
MIPRTASRRVAALVVCWPIVACSLVVGGQAGNRAGYLDDKVTQRRVEQALETHGGFPKVRVDVSGGDVALAGTVDSDTERREAERVAQSVERVKSVDNRISVAR